MISLKFTNRFVQKQKFWLSRFWFFSDIGLVYFFLATKKNDIWETLELRKNYIWDLRLIGPYISQLWLWIPWHKFCHPYPYKLFNKHSSKVDFCQQLVETSQRYSWSKCRNIYDNEKNVHIYQKENQTKLIKIFHFGAKRL